MIEFVVRSSGVFFVPQLALSLLVVALVVGYMVALARGELRQDNPTWHKALDPLAGVAVGVGLLGSVVSFCIAFTAVKQSGFEVARIASGLAMAYTTTAVGLITGLLASLGSWLLGMLVKR